MRRLLAFLAFVALACAVALVPIVARAQSASTCIRSWPETRYGAMAYNHIVHVANSCDVEADCSVSTDVNPEKQKVTVGARSEIEVMTYMGSPSRVFKPNVQCVMRKP